MTELTVIDISEINNIVLGIQRKADLGLAAEEKRGEGVVLLQNYSRGITGNGNPKISGTIVNIQEAKFNCWNNSAAYEFFENLSADALPCPVRISYTLSRYGLVINSAETVGGFDPEAFIARKYNVNDKAKEFTTTMKESGITEAGISVVRKVLHLDDQDSVTQRLAQEYAAYSYHDNCPTGLLAHITKCVKIYIGIKGDYKFLNDTRTNDLMVIGLILHDVGKIYEMHDGLYQKYSFLTHRGLGFEYLLGYKQFIVDLYDEEFFYMISSIILQHHGEYGENPRTAYAMLAHMIDNMEAQLTSIDTMIEDGDTTSDAAGTKIKYNGVYLNI